MSSLVTVMKDCQDGTEKNGDRDIKKDTTKKAKKDKKDKKAKKEDPQTTQEKKDSARSFLCENVFRNEPFLPFAAFFKPPNSKFKLGKRNFP